MRLLVVHCLLPNSRQTTIDHVACFQEHLPGVEVVFHHLHQPVERLEQLAPFDLIVLSYCFLGHRQTPQFEELEQRYRVLKELAPIAALPQDDYCHHLVLDDWLHGWRVEHVWSPVHEHHRFLYPRTSATATFHPALTGYVATERLAELQQRARPLRERSIDLGTRVRFLAPHLGRHGQAKGRLAEAMRAALVDHDFAVDISTDIADALPGDQWFDFLADCRFVLGQRGGASLADPDGSLRRRVEAYQAEHPDAGFDEIETACFAELDGRHMMSAISPRLFEAAALRTCQVLVPDDYLGLEPWAHYIPIEPDLANLDEVTDAMQDLDRAQEIADACYRELIESGRHGYRAFVREVVATATGTELTGENDPSGATRVFASTAEVRLPDTPERLGPDLFDAFRRWLLACADPSELVAVRDALERASTSDWVEGLATHDAAHQLPSATTRRFDAGLLCALVDEIRRSGGLDACLVWAREAIAGRLGRDQMLPWSEVSPGPGRQVMVLESPAGVDNMGGALR